MVWYVCNSTLEYEHIEEAKIWHNVEFHHIGLILSALFGLIAVLTSWFLIWMHCTHYLKPWEQRHIIRVLFMVPIYSIVSFLSYYFYRHAIYFAVIRDCYEAFAIASFFALMCSYIAPDLHNQKDYFRGIQPRAWVLPLSWFKKCCGGGEKGFLRTPRSGLTWFNIIWFGVFQYCFVRVFMTFVALVTQIFHRYCQESLNPAFAHIWVTIIEGGCVTVAMYCLIQFYIQIRADLAEHQPLLKISAIKLVIFLSFWQNIIINFLTSGGALKPTKTIQTPDLKIGIPSMLLCIEMAIFSIFHLWAFPWRVYDVRRSQIVASESVPGLYTDPRNAYHGGRYGTKALIEAFNVWDLIKNVGRGFRWFMKGRKTRETDVSYKSKGRLEPTRNALTAFRSENDHTLNPFNEGHGVSSEPYIGGGKPGRYQPLTDDGDDEDRLTASHPHSVPFDPSSSTTYPRPMERLSHRRDPSGSHEHGVVGIYDPPPPAKNTTTTLPYPDSSPAFSHPSLASQDTSYHGPRDSRRSTPVPPPDPHPLGPPGRMSYEHDAWDDFVGDTAAEREDERHLGGEHGVRDNRF